MFPDKIKMYSMNFFSKGSWSTEDTANKGLLRKHKCFDFVTFSVNGCVSWQPNIKCFLYRGGSRNFGKGVLYTIDVTLGCQWCGRRVTALFHWHDLLRGSGAMPPPQTYLISLYKNLSFSSFPNVEHISTILKHLLGPSPTCLLWMNVTCSICS